MTPEEEKRLCTCGAAWVTDQDHKPNCVVVTAAKAQAESVKEKLPADPLPAVPPSAHGRIADALERIATALENPGAIKAVEDNK